MKLFHISDLHLGKRVHEFSMLEAQEDILRKILDMADAEKPDILLITGDIYDRPTPPVEAVRLLDAFLTEIARRGLHTYIIAGNHDSAQRLEFGRQLMAKSGVFFCGTVGAEIDRICERDEYGEAWIYLLPFFKPAHVKALFPEETAETYGEAAEILLRHTHVDESVRNILLAHQFVTWRGTAQRSDSETHTLGGLEEIDAGLFAVFDYAALGHLHKPQGMGRKTVRYAGAPLAYSFSEARGEKGVTVVELREKGMVTVKFLPLSPKRALREIKGPLQKLLAAGRQEGTTEDYIRCILTDKEPLLDPIGQLRSIYPNLMTLEFEREESAGQEIAYREKDAREQDLFEDFFEKQNHKGLDDSQREFLENIWKELEGRL